MPKCVKSRNVRLAKPYAKADNNNISGVMEPAIFPGDGQSASSSGLGSRVLQESNMALHQLSILSGNGQFEQHCSPFRLPSCKAPTAPHLLKMRPYMPHLPEAHSADSLEIWNSMCWKDEQYKKDQAKGLETVNSANGIVFYRHPEITPRMRSILLDWMAEVSEVYKLHRTTYYMAVDYVDRYLLLEDNVPKRQLQLIGITALFTAAKIEEIYPPKVSEFAYVCDGACQDIDIIRMEIVLTQKLEWRLAPMTAVHWLAAYLQNVAHSPLNSAHNNLLHPMANTAENTPPQINGQAVQGVQPIMCANFGLAQPDHAKRNLFAGGIDVQPKQDAIYVSAVDKGHFLRICELLDLCVLDSEWTRHSAGELAAAAVCSLAARPDLAARAAAGLSEHDLKDCLVWMRPYAKAVSERPEPMTLIRPQLEGIAYDDQHNIQLHTVDMALMAKAQEQCEFWLSE